MKNVSELLNIISWILIAGGLFFFFTGSVGLLRFPDTACRLHAITKADTLGLGLVAMGVACRADDWHTPLALLFIWGLAMTSSAVTCQLLARYARDGLFPDEHIPDQNKPNNE